MPIFMNLMNSQSDETSILDAEILKPFKESFLKFFLWILHFGGGNFLEKTKKTKSSLNFFLPLAEILKNL